MRTRVGIAMALVLVGSSLVTAPQMLMERRWMMVGLALVTVLLAGACIHLFRRRRSPVLPAAILLSWLLVGLLFSVSVRGGLHIGASVWPGFLALLAIYMLGPRRGTVVAVLAIVQIFWSFALHHRGVGLPAEYLAPPDSLLSITVYAAGTAVLVALGYLYEAAHKRTLGELEEALIGSEHNERQLDALVESTTSAICALDREQRLLTWNQAFAALRPDGSPIVRGEPLEDVLPPERHARWQAPIARVLAGGPGPTAFEEPPPPGHDAPHRETVMHAIARGQRVTGVTVFSHDITARKRAEAELRRLNQELVRISRGAGMAAVASEVLHNAGNVLNSTGVSVAMLEQHAKGFKVEHLARAIRLLEQHRGALDAFLDQDPRGRRMFELFHGLADHFGQQQRQLVAEIVSLRENTEHLVRVIQAQQSHARALGIVESVSVAELIDAALDLQAPSWEQLGIALERRIPSLPPLELDRHKAIEILLNLVSNARHALRSSGRPDKRLRIRAELAQPETGGGRVRIHVEDNGVGVAPEHRDRLFRLGFTTKPDGNGIGLHASAIAAQQLGGALSCDSDGPGRGARFTLELPLARSRAVTSPGAP